MNKSWKISSFEMHDIDNTSNERDSYFNKGLKNFRSSKISGGRFVAKVIAYNGQVIKASALPGILGSMCTIECENDERVTGEVIGFQDNEVDILPYELNLNVSIGNKVILSQKTQKAAVGDELLGRVVDGLGKELDGQGPLVLNSLMDLNGFKTNPFQRKAINEVLDVGIRNINALLTIGRGQRVGIVAGSGVGKSVLLSMITKSAEADVVIVALIGERGRELASFTKEVLSSHSKDKVVVVAVPADRSPLLRIQGAKRATTIAEYFREKGKNVLLIMDSLTRVAHAQRELGLALGEQPTSRGYPPSVISLMPNLIERTGTNSVGSGSITSIYTILADGDDTTTDPVVDTARAILDGHIILSRGQAELGVYPAIDISASISRVISDITNPDQQDLIRDFRKYFSIYQENKDLLLLGGYKEGGDPELDKAIKLYDKMVGYIRQRPDEKCDLDGARVALVEILNAS